MNIKLTVAYDGTNYHGFQEQRGSGFPTIQEELQKALSYLGKENIQVIGAGRTDSGVHARGQVVNFHSDSWPVPLKKTPLALNTYLPPDVVVLQAEDVASDFHARFSALGKTYRYSIYNHPITDPFCIRYTLHEPRHLDENAMAKAAAYLVGEFDFKCFQAVGTPVKSTVRRITHAAVTRTDRRVCVEVSANGFLYNMVRIITGTLINVGLKKIKPEAIPEIIAAGNRKYAGKTVPPQGLSMEKVYYP